MIGTAQLINAFGAPVCFTDTTDIFKDRSGVALYGLDYDASDAGSASGKFGEAAIFNGSTSKIDLNNTFANNVTQQTWSAWAKFDNLNTQNFILFNENSGGGDGFGFFTWTNGDMYFQSDNTTNSNRGVASSSGLFTTGEWVHFAMVYDGTATGNSNRLKAYVNGVALTLTIQGTIPATTNSTSSTTQVGSRGGGISFSGSIDQVRIYDTALTQSQVTQLYQENNSTVGTHLFGCIANYNLDGSAKESMGTTAYDGTETDITYRYDGTPTDVDFGVGGKSNYGARFNGSSSNIQINKFSEFTNYNFTLSVWIKTTDTSAYITSFRDPMYITLGTGLYTGGTHGMGIYDGSNSYFINNAAMQGINDGNWHHIVMTHDGTNLKGYIDGSLIGTVSTGTTTQFSGGTNYNRIGVRADGNTAAAYDGDIDQLRLFNRAISSAEVSKLYGNGAGEIACTYTSTTDIVNYPTGTTPIAYYKLDNSSEDYSTGGYDGTDKNNIQYRFGKYGQAAVFDGINSHILLPTGSPFNDSNTIKTISGWVKRSGSGGIRLFSISDTGFNFIAVNILDTGLHFTNRRGSSSNQLKAQSLQSIDNNWHHVAIVYDASGIKWYLDGQEQTVTYTTTGTATNSSWISYPAYSGTPKAYIGRSRQNTPSYANGKIDQVRIYDAALTSDQVTELYNEKPCEDTSNFKTVLWEGNGSTQYISNVGFDLDAEDGGDGGLVWIKRRNDISNHALFDTVRGAQKRLESDTTTAESNYTQFSSFDANGFTLGNQAAVNSSGDDYVAWVWKGGGDAVLNEQGSIDSQVSANTDAGFSIVKWTGDATSNPTVGHGLNQEPDLYIVKELDNGTVSWLVGGNSTLFPETATTASFLRLDTTDDIDQTGIDTFGNSGQNLIKVGARTNNGEDSIAYCFHSVSGYSKIGSFVGDGSTDTVLDLGFEPKWIMIKNTNTTTTWYIMDFLRDNFAQRLRADANNVESGINTLTTSSTGITISSTASDGRINGRPGQSDTMLYMAFK